MFGIVFMLRLYYWKFLILSVLVFVIVYPIFKSSHQFFSSFVCFAYSLIFLFLSQVYNHHVICEIKSVRTLFGAVSARKYGGRIDQAEMEIESYGQYFMDTYLVHDQTWTPSIPFKRSLDRCQSTCSIDWHRKLSIKVLYFTDRAALGDIAWWPCFPSQPEVQYRKSAEG